MKIHGLLKFFRSESHLDDLLAGKFYCNTPEYYRMCESDGVGDKHESCIQSYRKARGDPPIILKMGGKALLSEGILEFTVHGRVKDSWLHCWMIFQIPESEPDLHSLISDINKVRSEFGYHFAFIPHYSIDPFVARLRELTSVDILHGPVKYSDEAMDWSAVCKSSAFSYQREYRFLLGQCKPASEPLVLQDSGGFRELIFKNIPLKLTSSDTKSTWLDLDTQRCFCPVRAT